MFGKYSPGRCYLARFTWVCFFFFLLSFAFLHCLSLFNLSISEWSCIENKLLRRKKIVANGFNKGSSNSEQVSTKTYCLFGLERESCLSSLQIWLQGPPRPPFSGVYIHWHARCPVHNNHIHCFSWAGCMHVLGKWLQDTVPPVISSKSWTRWWWP